MPDTFSIRAHAKVNLSLEILGQRDDGYHEIDTILQEVDLADTVTLTPGATWSVTASGPYAAGTPIDSTNLALKAALLLAERARLASTFSIHLEKHRPPAGGLGGGASDAAAVLRLLQTAWPGITVADVETVANDVGSDEAFFLVGGTARARGRGERVTELPPLPLHDVVLFVPHPTIERKTARMFAQLAGHPFDSGSVTESLARSLPARITGRDVFNAFERVAFDLFPWLAELWHSLEQRTGSEVRLAGAGPCLFWIGPPGAGAGIAKSAEPASCTVLLTKTVHRS